MRRRLPVFLSIVALLFLYTGSRLRRILPAEPGLAWALTFAFVGFVVGWQFAYRLRSDRPETVVDRILAWTSSIGAGIWVTFIILSLALDLLFLRSRWLTLGALAASGLLSGAGLWFALAGPRVRDVVIRSASLPPDLQGLRIVQLTDLHIGPTIRRDYLEGVVRAVEELRPDLIAVTGDLADGKPERLAPFLEPLSRLRAPLGVYYVTGNHEYYWGAEGWLGTARTLGWTPLVNENRLLRKGNASLLVAGVTDTSAELFIPSHASDPRKAAKTDGRPDFKLLLAHRPDSCVEAEQAGFDLQLSGHTHGGQFFPFSLLIRLVQSYPGGLYRRGALWLYVNVGTGYWGPPHRLAVRSEITSLTLEWENSEASARGGLEGKR